MNTTNLTNLLDAKRRENYSCGFDVNSFVIQTAFVICNIICLLTNLCNIITFALLRKFDAILVIFTAMAVIALSYSIDNFVLRILLMISSDFSLPLRILSDFSGLLYTIESWLIVLAAIFRFYRTQPDLRSMHSGREWGNAMRAFITTVIVSLAVLFVGLPRFFQKYLEWKVFVITQYYTPFWNFLFPLTIPGLIQLCFGVALLRNYCRAPEYDEDIEEREQNYSFDNYWPEENFNSGPGYRMNLPSYGPSSSRNYRAESRSDVASETGQEITLAVLIIVLLHSIIYLPAGVVAFLMWVFKIKGCGFKLLSIIFDWARSVLPCMNYFLYLMLLSEFRTVYRRYCCRICM